MCAGRPSVGWFVRSFLVQFHSFRGDVIVSASSRELALFSRPSSLSHPHIRRNAPVYV